MKPASSPTLRVCIEAEDGHFVAQCVDYDISAEGATIDAAIQAFIRLYMKYVLVAAELGIKLFETTPPAPQEYVDRWKRDAREGQRVYTERIPDFSILRNGVQVKAKHTFGAIEACVPAEVAA
ncbi:MAG: hypothetical protein AAF085_02065 [Planctomycetota bacterium]